MTTWAQFLSEIRAELDDTGTTPRYSDALLLIYAKDAVRDYSQYFPLHVVDEELETVDGETRQFSLPTDMMAIDDVQCPEGSRLQERTERPGALRTSTTKPMFYWIDGSSLVLNADPGEGEAVLLSYFALHPLPFATEEVDGGGVVPEEEPEVYTFTIPEGDMELIKNYVLGKVQMRVRNNQSRLDRFKVTSGARDDNPMIVEVEDYMDRYLKGIALRLRGGVVQLYRPRRFLRSTMIRRYPN
jgi:hypothetical protein